MLVVIAPAGPYLPLVLRGSAEWHMLGLARKGWRMEIGWVFKGDDEMAVLFGWVTSTRAT